MPERVRLSEGLGIISQARKQFGLPPAAEIEMRNWMEKWILSFLAVAVLLQTATLAVQVYRAAELESKVLLLLKEMQKLRQQGSK